MRFLVLRLDQIPAFSASHDRKKNRCFFNSRLQKTKTVGFSGFSLAFLIGFVIFVHVFADVFVGAFLLRLDLFLLWHCLVVSINLNASDFEFVASETETQIYVAL